MAQEPPANSTQIVLDNFEREELGKGWAVQTGEWKIQAGALQAKENPADHHSAAARYVVETSDAVYQLNFELSEGTKAFHFGFDPVPGELDKKGHLFSVIVTATGWKLMKHLDKNHPKEDPNEVLSEVSHPFEAGRVYTMRVTTWGPTVKATIEGSAPLTGSHPTFSVRKPTLVFRVVGDTVMIDDLSVWAASN